MLRIEKVDHLGIRISEKAASVAFYRTLGFDLIADAGFERGHPIVMRNKASGVTLNLLGPSTSSDGTNVLMDIDEKHPGYTHMALRVASMEETKSLSKGKGNPDHGLLQLRRAHGRLHPRPRQERHRARPVPRR